MQKKIGLLFFVLLISFSCRKYDENTLWFKNPDKIVEGYKKINSYFIDGTNFTDSINKKIDYLWFTPNNWDTDLFDFLIYFNDSLPDITAKSGVWKFYDNKKHYLWMQLKTYLDTISLGDTIPVDFFLYDNTE